MWFRKLVGFDEISPENVQQNIEIIGNKLRSKVNGKSYQYGKLDICTLEHLRNEIAVDDYKGKISLSEIVANVQKLHSFKENENALFQAASQFNLLEMVSPNITPEQGVDIYENDRTQGPACAISCGAGTIYRNYFVPINGKIGQTENNQVDGLELIGKALGNENAQLWKMQNGYCFPNREGLKNINAQILKMTALEQDELKAKLKLGIQWNTEVTTNENQQLVSQIYCSALPIGYVSNIEESLWENFARLILEAVYEATLYAGLINYRETGSKKVYLTLVGGGVFRNNIEWILDAISLSILKFKNTPLEVKVVSYGSSNYLVSKKIKTINEHLI